MIGSEGVVVRGIVNNNVFKMENHTMSTNAKLSKLSATWKKAEAITSSFSNIPDGEYIGDLKELKLAESKKGRVQVEATWEVADGELVGKTQKQFYGLSDNAGTPDAKGMGYWKNVCEVIGLDLPEDLNLWQETMDEFIGSSTALYDIAVKANGDYANVFVNGVSEYTKGAEGEEEAAEEETTEEEAVEAVEEEEIVEEEEVQEVIAPTKKAVGKVVVKPVAKAIAVPAKKVVVAAQPARKIVSLKR